MYIKEQASIKVKLLWADQVHSKKDCNIHDAAILHVRLTNQHKDIVNLQSISFNLRQIIDGIHESPCHSEFLRVTLMLPILLFSWTLEEGLVHVDGPWLIYV